MSIRQNTIENRVASSTRVPVKPKKNRKSALPLDHPSLYTNRELSWLEFNQRVLDQALDERHPLLERVKFLSLIHI